jgi:glycosyltransferase involved in cell wall biosynthesis
VEHVGFLSHSQVKDFEKNCDALLSTSAKIIGGEDYCIAGKTYEYLESGKPVLAFVSPGAQRDFLLRSCSALIFDPDNIEESARLILQVVEKGFTLYPDKAFLNGFHRKGLAVHLAELIEKVILDN